MLNYADEANLHARIYALKGRLLSMKDYVSLVRDKQADSIKLSPDHNPVETKENIFKEQISPIIRLVQAYDKYTPFFLAYLRQFETHNLKILLAKATGRESEELWYDIGSYAILEKSLLQKKLSLSEIRTLIANTYLEDGFKKKSSYRHMEINADICSAINFNHSAARLSRESRKQFQDMMQRRIAVLSIIWSYRLRKYYGLPDEKIRSYLQKFYSLYGKQIDSQIRQMEKALNQRLDEQHISSGQEPSAIDIEHHLEQDYFDWVSSVFYRDFHSLYPVIAYLWLLFYQIRNLFRVIDGLRFGFPANAILDKLYIIDLKKS